MPSLATEAIVNPFFPSPPPCAMPRQPVSRASDQESFGFLLSTPIIHYICIKNLKCIIYFHIPFLISSLLFSDEEIEAQSPHLLVGPTLRVHDL